MKDAIPQRKQIAMGKGPQKPSSAPPSTKFGKGGAVKKGGKC